MNFGIVSFPHKDVQDIANSYRKRYDPHYSLIPPHITLKDKFSLPEAEMEQITQALEKIGRETAPFEIHFHKVSHFHPVTHTVYFAIENPAALTLLHQNISALIPTPKPNYDFIPHLTIGQKMEEEELHDVYGRLKMTQINLSSKIDRFHLMYQLENQQWTIYQTFILQGV